MRFQINKLYLPIAQSKSRYNIIMGGRAAGRSTFASQLALTWLEQPQYCRCAIMRNVQADIATSIGLEIKDRLEEQEVNHIKIIESPYLTFIHGRNQIIAKGFKKSSSQQTAKLKSLAGFTHIIIEEADEISAEDFKQLDDSIRSIKSDIKIILLLNPPSKNHWIIKRWFNLVNIGVEGFYKAVPKQDDNLTYVFSTYLDNLANLNKTTINNYLDYKTKDPDHYYNMICGLVSEGGRGRIYQNWEPITNDYFESLEYPSFYGLDFGYSLDPNALIQIKHHNGKLYLKEMMYQGGLTNQDIAQRMFDLNIRALTYADSAEPKSIEELQRNGVNVLPATKGPDSLLAGIKMIKGMEVYVTQDSSNLWYEYEEYKWALDGNKEPTNRPIDKYNHLMDALRYGVYSELRLGKQTVEVWYPD